jgi:predicted nicotinamide N-methyase
MPKITPYAVELDGLHVTMVATTSKKAAAALIGTTPYMMTAWEGGINDADEAVALAEPGQVFRKRLIGSEPWHRVPKT